MSEGINITPAEIAQWEKDKTKFLREIAESQDKLAAVTKNLEAAAILMARNKPQAPKTEKPAPAARNGHDPHDGANLTDSIADIANRSAAPVAKKDIKKQLAAMGFPDDKLGPYFYTAIMRLKGKKRITVQGDGKIWRAPPDIRG